MLTVLVILQSLLLWSEISFVIMSIFYTEVTVNWCEMPLFLLECVRVYVVLKISYLVKVVYFTFWLGATVWWWFSVLSLENFHMHGFSHLPDCRQKLGDFISMFCHCLLSSLKIYSTVPSFLVKNCHYYFILTDPSNVDISPTFIWSWSLLNKLC